MKRKLMLLMAFLVIGIGLATAQVRVTGNVTSKEDGLPIVGASVLVKGTTLGAITDSDGNFSVNAPSSATTLRVSYIGMKPVEVAIKRGGGKQLIVLESDALTIGEAVVTAMGIKRSEKALGYSAATVKSEDITKAQTGDIMTGLAGKVAGVQISTTSSDPGSSNSVIVRGISSLSGNNQPLYVIDGVPMNNAAVYSDDGLNSGFDFGNGANAVNPEDVESMSLLKGAAATALYGSRAANGVIMITTKSGRKGQGLGIEYNGNVQWESVLRLPQMQNRFGQGWYGDKTEDENGSWGPAFDGMPAVWGHVYENSQKLKPYVALKNNIRDFFDTGFRYSNSVSFNGATDNSTYYISLGQLSDDGIVPTSADTYKKYNISARGSHKTGDFTFSSTLNYAYQKNNFATTGQGLSMYNSVMQSPRDISLIGLKNLNDPFNTPGYYYTPYGVMNPYYILGINENTYDAERFYGKVQVDYDFLKYFRVTYRLGLDQTASTHHTGQPNLEQMFYKDEYPNGTPQGSSSPFYQKIGSVTNKYARRREINHDLMVTFDKDINEEFHVNALAGFNGNERSAKSLYSSVEGLTIPTWYNLANSANAPVTSESSSKRRLYGFYGQFEGSWRDMLYLTITARNDVSSTLPKENRSYFYPGFTGSFIFSELLDKSLKDIISFGKFRAAWGKTGNDAAPYLVQSVYAQGGAYGYWTTVSNAFPYLKSGVNAYTVGNRIGSNTLSPEMTSELELGLNMAFLKNRLSFDFTYYNRITDKQIYSLNMDPASGYTSQVLNLGEVRNRGLELMVTGTPIKTKDWQWDITLNWAKNWSKVLSLPEELGGEATIYGLNGGVTMKAIVGQPVGVFKATTPKMTPDGRPIVDAKTGIPVANSEQSIVGDMNYKYTMGIGSTLRYKSLSLSADFDIRHGGVMYSRTRSITYFTGNAIQTAYNDRNPYIIPNSVNEVVAPDGTVSYVENKAALSVTNIYKYLDDNVSGLDYLNMVDKSYVKLRSLVLSYELPTKWLEKTPLKGVTVSAYGNNLFVWTPSSNTYIDPEMTSFGNDLEGNYGEWSANPSSRRFGLNLKLKF